MKYKKQKIARTIYLNKEGTRFYTSGFSWDSFSSFLDNKNEIVLKHLILMAHGDGLVFGPGVCRPMNEYDKPFEKMYLPTTWPVVNDLIKSMDYFLYEYHFNLTPELLFTSASPSELLILTEGGKTVKDEIYKIVGNKCELIDLIKVAGTNANKILYVDESCQIEEVGIEEDDIEEFIWSGGMYNLD